MQKLYTEEGRALRGTPWERYPRPQLRREDWLCLNGTWELRYEDGQVSPILVPFCPESLLSGAARPPRVGEKLCFRRAFVVPEAWAGRRVLLHFGAVGREAAVFVNGTEVCRHDEGYLSFSADITDALRAGENELLVTAVNDLSPRHLLGKQSARRGGMWYTPCSGIWQTVWLEPVPETYVRALRITNGPDWAEITAEGAESGWLELEGERRPLRGGTVRLTLPEPRLWSPEDPFLYRFTLTSGEDRVSSYFALRTLSVETVGGIPRLCLNGKPRFFNGLLDQGYWSDGLYTPASPDCFEKDIRAMKALGFNTLRKHIKIEPELFYYDCDRLGMLVFQDMVNTGGYRFLRDTALPTLGLRRRGDRRLNPDPAARGNFLAAMEETVRLLGNHPSICLWTIFNEGWGQFRADDAYRRLRALDGSRFVDSTSGWFRQSLSDVESLHIYFGRLRLGKSSRPQLLSEFGGYILKLPEHSFNPDKTYGYRLFRDRESFVAALRALYASLRPLVREGLCGAVYTQVSDVEDETNGLLTFDRAETKIRPAELLDLAQALDSDIRRQADD